MPAERARLNKPVRSFVSPCSTQLADKENSHFPRTGSASRSQVTTPSSRRRRRRTTAVNPVQGALPRRRSGLTSHSQTPHDDVRIAAPNFEREPPARCQITLPRHLSRPGYQPIDPRVIAAIDPLLENIPLNYIQYTLEEIGPQLLQVTSNATATPPSGQLPREMIVICNDVSVEPPSHVLAVYRHTGAPRCGVTLFPAHALVLAANCAHLPDLPQSKPQVSSESECAITLPIVPLRIPSPPTFPLLLSYLYTKRSDHMLTALLPLPQDEEAVSMEQLARKHAALFTHKSLVGYAQTVHGVWSNAFALGVFDDKLFRTVEMVWEVLLSALTIRLGANFTEGIEVDAE